MKIDLELKTGTDRDVVASLRKIVALPIDHGQKVELVKRLLLDSIAIEGNRASSTQNATLPKMNAERFDADRINANSREQELWTITKAKHVGCFDYYKHHTTQDQIDIAGLLIDPHWFAWAVATRGKGRLLLLCWQARFGDKPEVRSNIRLLTDWSLTVPPVPSI